MSAVIPETTDLSKYVELRPYEPVSAYPFIRGRRLPVSFIGRNYVNQHKTVAEIASVYSVSEEEILAGVLYYLEHRDEVEAVEEEVTEFYRPFFEEGQKQLAEMRARRPEKTEQP
jgi:uncharacterized protein (DUF433 family)